MHLSEKDFKIAGFLNTVLLGIATVLWCFTFKEATNAILTVFGIVYILTVIAAFVYTFAGYKKKSAVFYKTFMLLYGVFTLLQAAIGVTKIIEGVDGNYKLVMLFSVIGLMAIYLAFVKNFGEVNSKIAVLIILFLQVMASLALAATYSFDFRSSVAAFMHIVLSCTASVFILMKYRDKEKRNAKE